MDSLLQRTKTVVTSRWFVKGAFLAFFAFSVVQLLRFYAWTIDKGPYVPRPEAVAGILPVGHFTSFFAWVRGGGWDHYLPAGLVIILGALATSLLFKRGFCGWICPVGTVCEAAAATGRKVFGRNYLPPKFLDIAGRAFRYLLAAAAVAFVFLVPLQEAVGFRLIPYMRVADIKIVLGFANPVFILVALVALVIMAIIGPFWCRYLCPLGGIYSAVGILSPCAVRRDEESCIHCSKCTQSCHAFIDVESKPGRVWQPECDGCMDCVKVCPVDECLTAEAPARTKIAPWVWPLLVVALWLAIWGFAKVTGNWNSGFTPEEFRQAVQTGVLQHDSVPSR